MKRVRDVLAAQLASLQMAVVALDGRRRFGNDKRLAVGAVDREAHQLQELVVSEPLALHVLHESRRSVVPGVDELFYLSVSDRDILRMHVSAYGVRVRYGPAHTLMPSRASTWRQIEPKRPCTFIFDLRFFRIARFACQRQ